MTVEFDPLRIGILGMGRAFTLMLPTFLRDTRCRLLAGYDPNARSMAAFSAQLGGRIHASAEALCADPDVEWIYVASPHQYHVEHVRMAAEHGKNVLVEKPMALTLQDCQMMVDDCDRASVALVVGHSHSFNTPVLMAAHLCRAQVFGQVRMVHTSNFTDFLYRPRRPEELDTGMGGGVVFSQAAHQIDIVRLLAGGLTRSVFAMTGKWDPGRPTEGAYSALLQFEGGCFASASYNGYGFYDTDALMDGYSEMGNRKAPDAHHLTRSRYHALIDEAAEVQAKADRNFGGSAYVPALNEPPAAFQHFGPTLVSCEGADIRLTPLGLEIVDSHGRRIENAPAPSWPRKEVIDEIWEVGRKKTKPTHCGRWAKATTEVCLGILQSSRLRRDIMLEHQVAVHLPNSVCPSYEITQPSDKQRP